MPHSTETAKLERGIAGSAESTLSAVQRDRFPITSCLPSGLFRAISRWRYLDRLTAFSALHLACRIPIRMLPACSTVSFRTPRLRTRAVVLARCFRLVLAVPSPPACKTAAISAFAGESTSRFALASGSRRCSPRISYRSGSRLISARAPASSYSSFCFTSRMTSSKSTRRCMTPRKPTKSNPPSRALQPLLSLSRHSRTIRPGIRGGACRPNSISAMRV